MRVLLTGAAGFLGRHVAARLVAAGHEVVAVDLAFDPAVAEARCVRADVTDRAAMAAAARGADAVIHGAALTGLWHRDPAAFERVNAGGTRTVLAAAAEAGAGRAVHVSSFVTLIGGRRSDPPREVDERTVLPPEALAGPYPRAKRLAEIAAAGPPLPAVILMPSAPVGPGDAGPTPPGRLVRDLATGRVPAMLDCLWSLVDIRAVADACVAALTRGEAGERYLLAGPPLSTEAFLALMARLTGRAMPRARAPYAVALAAAFASEALASATGRPPGAPLTGVRLAGPRLAFRTAKAEAALGFRPGPLEAALRDQLAWMAARGWVPRDLACLADQPRP